METDRNALSGAAEEQRQGRLISPQAFFNFQQRAILSKTRDDFAKLQPSRVSTSRQELLYILVEKLYLSGKATERLSSAFSDRVSSAPFFLASSIYSAVIRSNPNRSAMVCKSFGTS